MNALAKLAVALFATALAGCSQLSAFNSRDEAPGALAREALGRPTPMWVRPAPRQPRPPEPATAPFEVDFAHADLWARIRSGYALGEVLPVMDEVARRVLPPSAATDLDGISREFRDNRGSIYLTFVLALAFIYLVLAAQFESFVDPFIIMLSVPLSMLGALLALKFTGGTLNVFSQIGLITLVGLITKHGILIVEFANQLREQGKNKLDAVMEAAALRLRPILMTTGAMVLGAIPLALAVGAGSESRQQIGWVIVGGLLVGTFFTLFVVPTVYSLLARKETQAVLV